MPRLSKIGAAALAAFGWTGLQSVNASYLVVAGGGAGGGNYGGGGGGAGGLLTGTISLNPTQSYTVTVGAGGTGSSGDGTNGGNSVFSSVTATGGGKGGSTGYTVAGSAGGSGGGGSGDTTSPSGGAGTSGQGNNGGAGAYPATNRHLGGGGGGAGAAGGAAGGTVTGTGGNGTASSISGTSVTYAGGGSGGGFANTNYGATAAGTPGTGGGGQGYLNQNGGNGSVNLGGGGGGTGTPSTSGGYIGGNGGSGIVIISYAGAQQFGGGIITSSGGNTIHTFTTSGTLSPLSSLTANFLVVAGGGGGGASYGGGGGAGGLRSSVTNTGGGGSLESALTIDTNSIYLVTVGAGGAGAVYTGSAAVSGSNSAFLSVTSTGGGRSGQFQIAGASGGSGGGGGAASGTGAAGGSGTANQGFAGGTGAGYNGVNGYAGGGGGGAGAVGQSRTALQDTGGAGGAGVTVAITGSSVGYAGGGGGSGYLASGGTATDGGGAGADYNVIGSSGAANKGGGGGGGGDTGAGSGNGGSGIVIISYPGSTPQMAGGTVTAAGGNIIHTFTSSGYLTPIVLANNSLRFRSSASAYLNRTPSVASNRKTWTWSAWVKLGTIAASNGTLFNAGTTSGVSTRFYLRYTGSQFQTGYGSNNLDTTVAVYRDPSAYYHVVLAVDTTQATAANRLKIYVNGVQQTVTTSVNYSQNDDTAVNNTVSHQIGSDQIIPGGYFDGYMTDINFVDGLALTPNSFGTFNGLGVWQPIRYGGSYGTNGFYLPFTGDSSFYGSFNGSNQFLQATLPATLTGAFTIEFFLYRSGTGNQFCFTLGDSNTSTGLEYYIGTTGTVNNVYSASAQISTSSNVPVANAWNHVAVTRDSSNVVRLFVNGVQAGGTWTTTAAFSSTLRIGVEFFNSSITGYVNGGLSNFRIVNGTALYTNNFAPPTSVLTAVSGTAILTLQNSTIIDNSGNSLSITNNGTVTTSQAYPFTMIGNQSRDYSPQGNNWTNNNIGVLAGSTLDIMTDVPTLTSATVANYCVLNPLGNPNGPITTYSNGNLTWSNSASSGNAPKMTVIATIGNTSGKWYFEQTAGSNVNQKIGFSSAIVNGTARGSVYFSYVSNGSIETSAGISVSGTPASYTTNDVVGVAFDIDAGTATFYKNNTSQATLSNIPANTWFPYAEANGSASPSNGSFNFGQQPFTYTPPSGFVRMNTFNIPTPTIGATPATTANKYMDATTYTGNGGTQSITSLGFQPDLVWVKRRNAVASHNLVDAVRGASKILYSDATTAEITDTNDINAFNSNGWTMGLNTDVNASGGTYVGWTWRGANGTVTNTAGSIISTVSANTTAGFSIVTYTGNATAGATVGHGLGVAPNMVIIKSRGAVTSWSVYHSALGATQWILLNSSNAATTSSQEFNNTAPTSSVFTIGNSSSNSNQSATYVAYCFAQVAGYSAFGSYTGNGSDDGTFVYTGFRPRFVMVKRSDSTADWIIIDSARNPYNAAGTFLYPNLSNAEDVTTRIDFVSNGFKLRTTAGPNNSGSTWIYMAVAESPFKYANAR